ncbi:MAG: glycosyltransferase [Prevotella sp.]|jgi:glycosyltransferase involved in cell wall biosynthesis|nr:glycosyltransferase [Prevotella sp.]
MEQQTTGYQLPISIIIPVFNAEKYLKRCMDSILSQTFCKFECILVDDASSDKSPIICDEYGKKDSRIKVLHKNKNGGAAQARSTGLTAAKGIFVLFADSDDWIEKTMIEKLYNKAIDENYDFVCCDYYEDFPDKTIYCKQEPANEKKVLIKEIIAMGCFSPVTWNKLIKHDIYNKVIFPETSYSDDRAIMPQVLHYSNKIGYVNEALYHWCVIENSVSRNKNYLKCIIEDFISYTVLIVFIRDNLLKEKDEYISEIYNHINKLCLPNRIDILYKSSIQRIVNNIELDKISLSNYIRKEIEKNKRKFEKADKHWITSIVKNEIKKYPKIVTFLKYLRAKVWF